VSNGGVKNRIAQNGLYNFFNLFSDNLIESVILPKEKAYSIIRLKCPEWSRVIVNATQSTRFVTSDFKGNQLNLICFHLAAINQTDEETCIHSDKFDRLRFETNRPVAYPNGLRLIENFISPDTESRIINRLLLFEKSRLSKRSILQFGRKIDFATKSISSFVDDIPEELHPVLSKISELTSEKYDQILINLYDPGDSFPSHVDDPIAYGDTICSLSLLSDYNINFKNYIGDRTGDRFDMNLPRRSLLIMSGEARYNWKHGILPKTFDYCSDGSIRPRKSRISITCRKVIGPYSGERDYITSKNAQKP